MKQEESPPTDEAGEIEALNELAEDMADALMWDERMAELAEELDRIPD